MRPSRAALLAVLVAAVPLSAGRGEEPVLDSPMYRSPDLSAPPVVLVLPEKAKGLWLKALERPEADLRCQAAQAIARAHRLGFEGMKTTVGPLLAALDAPDSDEAVRLAVAQALVTLDARSAAPNLLKHARSGGPQLRALVEPALARWDHRPARAVWLERLRAPEARPRSLVLAVRGLAAVREAEAADRLRELALSGRTPGPIRVEAARALAELRAEGLEKDAGALAADASPRGLVGRLVSASLLRKHRSKEAVGLLQRLAQGPEPAVASPAVARLLELDPKLVLPGLVKLLASPDAGLRSQAVEALLRLPTKEHVRLLGDRLDDVHPEVRAQARRALRELATKGGLREEVLRAGTAALAGKGWRAQEQAAILLTRLDHKPAAGRLAQLLKEDRPEVFATAAWGLRRLAVPKTLPAALRYVESQREGLFANRPSPRRQKYPLQWLDLQLAQLNQFLGEQKYRPADAALKKFTSGAGKSTAPESRAAAIWALGLFHEGSEQPALARALEARLNDMTSIPPESPQVRRLAAVTLGRLKAKSALTSLRRHFRDGKPSADLVNNACGWAIGRITGKAMPRAETVYRRQGDWFLVPLD
jgi:HEAT repeat protein